MKKQKKLSIHKLEEKCEEYLSGWKRCQADFENYKKLQEEGQEDFRKFAAENLIMQILPVLDNFHASTDHVPENEKDSPWVAGIMHIQKQLENVLTENNVTEIEAKTGDKFDYNIHEATHPIEVPPKKNHTKQEIKKVKDEPEKKNKSKINKIVKKGYQIGDKIIRPAIVVVE
ncbi:nucleotide exchange factor GrpE [Patescibacteria group bacterium]